MQSINIPSNLSGLAGFSRNALRTLHDNGQCPDTSSFEGDLQGLVLGSSVISRYSVWRGKHFIQQAGKVTGFNRLGVGPLEVRRYRFEAQPGPSIFADRQVLLINHDLSGNPAWVRAFHDELVQLRPGLFLATSHQQWRGRLVFRAHFALSAQK